MKNDKPISEYEQARLDKVAKLNELGVDPYGGKFPDTEPLQAIAERYDPENEEQIVRGAGRIILLREFGKLSFVTIRDQGGTLQIGLSKSFLGDRYAIAKLLDLGDIVGVEGKLGKTKKGEITIWVTDLTLLCKATLPPPEKWHGLQDVELRYRRRYVDLFVNPDVMATFKDRVGIIQTMRQFLQDRRADIGNGLPLFLAKTDDRLHGLHTFVQLEAPRIIRARIYDGTLGEGRAQIDTVDSLSHARHYSRSTLSRTRPQR